MSKFCTGCGSPLLPGASFCTSCGKKVDILNAQSDFSNYNTQNTQSYQYNPVPYYGNTTIGKPKKRKPLWFKISIALLITVLILTPIVYGVWKAGEITGFWEDRALKKAAQEWKKQPDLKTEEQEIFAMLSSFKSALSRNDIESAMTSVHPLSRDEITTLFTEYGDKIPVFVTALDTLELIYLSEDQGYFEATRMAKVMVGIPSDTEPVTGVSYIFLIKDEEGWVIEKIL